MASEQSRLSVVVQFELWLRNLWHSSCLGCGSGGDGRNSGSKVVMLVVGIAKLLMGHVEFVQHAFDGFTIHNRSLISGTDGILQ